MYGRKKIRQLMHSSVYHLRSRHPNCPNTENVPATEVLGMGSDRWEAAKQQSKVLASEIEMLLFFYINYNFAINYSQSILYL